MDSSLTDLLLTSYLSEQLRTKSSYIYGWTPPSHNFSTLVDSSTHNPLLSLEKIYNHLQQNIYSSTATTNTVPSASVSTVGGDDNSSVISTIVGEDKIETDSQISITVCDEAKTVKRQFTCNRTLLIREMRYFSDYLKDEPEQLEEVDISVHCDLDIFQWLMNYVKRNSHNQLEPQLEPRIAISILISSDFLKMEKLVEKSLDYIHTHISEIIQTNCNMASIPEHLVKSLVQLFSSPYEIESIKDRKDKIRSKLFEYSLEHMLTSTLTKLIRCATCQNIMTIEDMMLLPCLEEKMFIKQNGKLFYQHKIDSKFDINQWIKDIYQRSELSWRDTYWMVWLHMNSGYCDRCKNYFRYVDYNQCSYHSSSTVTNGIYACCGKQSNGFSLFLNQYQSFENGGGCQNGDHVLDDASEQLTKLNKSESLLKLIKQQQTMKQLPDTAIKQNFLFQVIEQSLYTNNTLTNSSSLITLNTPNTMTMVGMIGKKPSRSLWTYLIDTNPFGPNLKYQWDACKSTRWNQDTQREDEHRRNDVMLRYIQNEQMAKSTINRNVQTKDLSLSNTNTPSVNFPGGFYCRIENDWRMRTSNTTTANNSNKDSPNSSLLNLKNRQRLLK